MWHRVIKRETEAYVKVFLELCDSDKEIEMGSWKDWVLAPLQLCLKDKLLRGELS